MADENKLTNHDVNRRQFFMRLGLGSLSIAAVGTAAFAYQYLEPNVLFEPSPVVNAGKKLAVIIRKRLCIHPVCHSSRIPASTMGYPVRPFCHVFRSLVLLRHG